LSKVLASLGLGVMEYWSFEKKDIHPFVITPILSPIRRLYEPEASTPTCRAEVTPQCDEGGYSEIN
jgi:hypothetical protein